MSESKLNIYWRLITQQYGKNITEYVMQTAIYCIKRFINVNIFPLISLCLIASCGYRKNIPSPDGSKVARTSKASDSSILVITILDINGKVLQEVTTSASVYMNYSVKWLNNTAILIDSSDIGLEAIVLKSDGTWKRENPHMILSPDGTLVTYTYWSSSETKKLVISLIEAEGNVEDTGNVLHKFITQITVSNLAYCARWEGNDRVVVKADDGEHAWQREADGSWGKAIE